MRKLLNLSSKFLPFLIIFTLVIIFFHPVFINNKVPLSADIVAGTYFPWLDYQWGYPTGVPVKNPITSDSISFSFPMRMLAIDLIKGGQWPLWNPYILSGTPLLANFQSAPFSPTNMLYFIFDKLTAWSWQIILQHILAFLFTYWLLRHWRVGKFGALAGGTIFAFSGFNIIWSLWNALTLTAAFIPLLILLTDRFLLKRKWLDGIGISLTITLQILSGYPQLVLYTFLVLLVFLAFRLFGQKNWLRKTILFGIYILLGVGLAAFQLLPGWELISLSQREDERIPQEWAFLSWKQVITFLAPDFFGNHATGNFWGPKNYTSTVGFVSVVGFIFALNAILGLWKKVKEIKILAILGILSLIIAFPTPVGIFLWQSKILGLQAGISLRILVIFCLVVALLAGFGLDYWLKEKKNNLMAVFIVPALILGGFGLYALNSLQSPTQDLWKFQVGLRNLFIPVFSLILVFGVFVLSRYQMHFRRFGAYLLILMLVFELFYFGWKYMSFSSRHIVYPQTPVIDFLEKQERPFRFDGGQVVPANLFIPYKIEGISGYDAVYPLNMAKFIGVVNSGDPNAQPQDRYGIINNYTSQLTNLINSKYLLIKIENLSEYDKEQYLEVFRDKSVAVLENKNVLSRAFLVYDWEVVKDSQEILKKLVDPISPKDKKILLNEFVSMNQFINTEKMEYQVRYLDYLAQESTLQIVTRDNGMLFVSDTFYPGWKAYVDGQETKIYQTNYVFRAVPISAGEHEVKFVYQPDSFYNGIKIGGISLLTLLLLAFINRKFKWIN